MTKTDAAAVEGSKQCGPFSYVIPTPPPIPANGLHRLATLLHEIADAARWTRHYAMKIPKARTHGSPAAALHLADSFTELAAQNGRLAAHRALEALAILDRYGITIAP